MPSSIPPASARICHNQRHNKRRRPDKPTVLKKSPANPGPEKRTEYETTPKVNPIAGRTCDIVVLLLDKQFTIRLPPFACLRLSAVPTPGLDRHLPERRLSVDDEPLRNLLTLAISSHETSVRHNVAPPNLGIPAAAHGLKCGSNSPHSDTKSPS